VTTYHKRLLTIAAFYISITGCKLDPVVVPTTIGTAYIATVSGITVVGHDINDDYLTGQWKVIRTTQQYYDSLYVSIAGTGMPGKYNSISLNDKTKAFQYNGLLMVADPATGSYKLNVTNNVLFINLTSNPFFKTSVSQVRITNLTATAMTWVTMDTTLINYNGTPARQAYEVTFVK
jgi:hypothetical protein